MYVQGRELTGDAFPIVLVQLLHCSCAGQQQQACDGRDVGSEESGARGAAFQGGRTLSELPGSHRGGRAMAHLGGLSGPSLARPSVICATIEVKLGHCWKPVLVHVLIFVQ